MRVALVLGAGGVIGSAYHAGALTALEHDLGWDPRHAEVIVGTSAGSLVGALLRSGVPASDLAAWTVGAPLSPGGLPIADVLTPEFDPVSWRMFLRLPRPPHPRAVLSTARRPWRFDPVRAFVTHLADGSRSMHDDVAFLGDGWPRDDLYIAAVRRRDGTREIFGREGIPEGGLAAAVEASCAVPGYFAPVEIAGVQYIDGGVASPTNADAVRHDHLDLAIVVSPMSTVAHLPRYSVDRVVRDRAGAQLRREIDGLRRAGIPAVVLEPGGEVLAHMTNDFMSDEHTQAIVAAAFLETGDQLHEPHRRDLLAPLRARSGAAA